MFEETKEEIPKDEDNNEVPEFKTGNEESPEDNIYSLQSILLDDFKNISFDMVAWLHLQNMKSTEADQKEADEE